MTKKKSIIHLLFIICIFILAFTACKNNTYNQTRFKKHGVWVYTEDFTVKYKDTLDAMFGDNWNIKIKKEKKVIPDGEETPKQFTEWQIQYTNANNELKVFHLNNICSLSEQIEDYINDYISGFYKEHFFNKYLKNVPLTNASCVWGGLVDVSIDPELEDNKDRVMKTKEYRENLEIQEGTIDFTKFTPANAFEMCPLYLSIYISIDDSKYSINEKLNLKEVISKQVDLMVSDMNEFTDNKINTEITILNNQKKTSLDDGDYHWTWYYLHGKPVSIKINPSYFDKYVYESYKGVFW